MQTIHKIRALVNVRFDQILSIRRHLHAHPELSFEEKATAAYISEYLKTLGVRHVSGVAGHGIEAYIDGGIRSKRVVALRADMDALPIVEQSEHDYRSTNQGVMHACGHDAHTASVMGAIMVLQEIRNEIEGTVKILFQPAEEKLPGGASLMIAAGALENPTPSAIVGQHVFPELATGKVGFRSGIYMASSDEVYITIKGKGGHAAMPHLLKDPVLMAAEVILSLQSLVSRNSPPTVPTVLSFGGVHAGGVTNVIPDEVSLQGTFRTLDEGWRVDAHDRIKSIVEGICQAHGGSAEVRIEKGYPCLVNEPTLTTKLQEAAIEYLGSENVIDLPIRMTSEDFAFYSQKIPACFYRLGTGNPSRPETCHPVHTSRFDIDEESLKVGAGLMAWFALKA